ncbi:MAG: helical backbone metal receptor [Flavobacteriales bacterium]
MSVVPSQTEYLFDLGLENEVVGITKFCIHPPSWLKTKHIVGGTKKLKIDLVRELNPDLIIANKEENTLEDIKALQKEFEVYVSDVTDISSALKMMKDIATICNRVDSFEVIHHQILSRISNVNASNVIKKGAIYLIWNNPLMTVGGDTFISDMMKHAGFHNLFIDNKRYPTISIQEIQTLKPEYLLLSSEPFPFNESHLQEFSNLLPETRVIIVDGEMFSWYGSRISMAFDYFKQWID